MKKIYLLFICIFLSSGIFGQTNTEVNPEVIGFDGTYQIEIHNVRHKANFPGNIKDIVNINRRENETVYIPLDSNIRIKIPSRAEVNNPNFEQLEFIKYY